MALHCLQQPGDLGFVPTVPMYGTHGSLEGLPISFLYVLHTYRVIDTWTPRDVEAGAWQPFLSCCSPKSFQRPREDASVPRDRTASEVAKSLEVILFQPVLYARF